MSLRLDWCDARAARYACAKWHYSGKPPAFKTSRIGVWEDGQFIGAVIFGCGASPQIECPFGVGHFEICELCRVALRDHRTSVTRIVAIALRMLKRQSPGIRIVVSYADTAQGHVGVIYQAGNWYYLGASEFHAFVINGKVVHPRTQGQRYGYGGQSVAWMRENLDPNAKRVKVPGKHKYAIAFDREARAILQRMSKPYPKRAGSIAGDASPHQGEQGGSTPTPALLTSE